MKDYRPLLLRELDVRLPGLHLRRLRLHRHLPEVDTLSKHSHQFTQILCYLAGRGVMHAANRRIEIHPGAIAVLPPRCEHSFEETTGRRPLCLVMDLDWRGAGRRGAEFSHLSQSDAGHIRRELSLLTQLSDPSAASCRLLVAAAALRILDVFFRAIAYLPARRRETPQFVRDYDRYLEANEAQWEGIAEAARQLGYQPDYLNRIFKQATGQTLREYRDARQLKRAKRLLAARRPINEVGAAVGIFDQSYFSRWFKKHAGLQPKAFQSSVRADGAGR